VALDHFPGLHFGGDPDHGPDSGSRIPESGSRSVFDVKRSNVRVGVSLHSWSASPPAVIVLTLTLIAADSYGIVVISTLQTPLWVTQPPAARFISDVDVASRGLRVNLAVAVRPKLHYTDTGYGHVVYNTTNGHHQRTSSQQFYNKFATSQCQSPTSRHVKM